MKLHTLTYNKGAKHRIKRLGKGESSGLGKTAGKGHKGQKARTGRNVRVGFEGGQMPLHRRLPKRGFNNTTFATKYAIINLCDIDSRFDDGATITEVELRQLGLVKGIYDAVKLLGNGELTKKFTISVDKISKSAQEAITKAGGSFTELAKVEKAEESSDSAE